jgi:DNA polymerase II large subunit
MNYNTIQDRKPNFRNKSGKLFLVRCFACNNEFGKENIATMVYSGKCAWCGYDSQNSTSETLHEIENTSTQTTTN